MGSEIIVVLVPVGMMLLAFLVYRSVEGPRRPYPVVTLILTVAFAIYFTVQAKSHYFTWFFIFTSLFGLPIGALAHLAKWAVGLRGSRT